ncbi:MAG: ABC transporter ATP-binding protein [Sporomusaceae bacterium]|nr:ABC transporter ATP-binding protein [Sporomusaceae bacterium]
MAETILELRNVVVDLPVGKEVRRILHSISFTVQKGEILGLVGESGSGKSVTASAILQLLPGGSKAIQSGKIYFKGQDITQNSPEAMRNLRGKEIAMIFQEPMTSLNPVFTIGRQFTDMLRTHQPLSAAAALKHAAFMLQSVQIPEPERILKSYPYELSGGMRQRVMIAMAQACAPALLIADEPTTALDVTIQAQILRLFRAAAAESGASAIFISHDLGVVSQLCQRVAVMYAGEIVEVGPVDAILKAPKHPYTQALLHSIPDFQTERGALQAIPGSVPDLRSPLAGCPFTPRCEQAQPLCQTAKPDSCQVDASHQVSCWNYAKEAITYGSAAGA